MTTSQIIKDTYEQIKKKDNKTKDEQYIIQKRYRVSNTPRWFNKRV